MSRKTLSVDLVFHAQKAVEEIADARKQFQSGKLGAEQASAHIGLFNATSRVINTAIHAEKWAEQRKEKK
jgi:hypothetical protein